MSGPQRYEKDEKDEKELEKHEEKTVEEKWHRDPLGSMIWALILIWAGVVWLAWNFGLFENNAILKQLITGPANFQPPFAPLILVGAGILLLLEVVIRLIVPKYRRSVIGSIILAAVFIGLGLGNTISWGVVWPVIIIAIGLMFILQGIFRRK
jgi:vacuolar-type H+-ATPase subunit I/STV1